MYRDTDGNFRSARVLLVEQDRGPLAALGNRLIELGFKCAACNTVSEAMTRFETGNFDLVVADLTMPGLHGLSIVGLIRSESAVPILVLTECAAGYQRFTSGYRNVKLIEKPVEPEVLLLHVRNIFFKASGDAQLKVG
jgi:DNA-binding response OmpR family regulator